MTSLRLNSRLPVGSAAWISEERGSALQIADSEAEEFTFSARNELDWLNEHMSEIFSENQLNVTEIFKTPGKLRGKTPRTIRKRGPGPGRAPLSDIFSATPKGVPSPFRQLQHSIDRHAPKFVVAEDPVESPTQRVSISKLSVNGGMTKIFNDSGYHGSQSQASTTTEFNDRKNPLEMNKSYLKAMATRSGQPARISDASEEYRTTEESFQSAKEEQTTAVALEESTAHQEPLSSNTEREYSEQHPSPVQPQNQIADSVPSPKKPLEELVDTVMEEAQHEVEPKPNAQCIPEEIGSPSEGSSPIIAPLVRKSSLTFASLPAREPLTAKQSIGNRTSRTSHLEQSRISYFGRSGGKSLGNIQQEENDENEDDEDRMDVDVVDCDGGARAEPVNETKLVRAHSKTSTQRLQDQISMLGQSQSQAPRPSRSIPNLGALPSQSANVLPSQDSHRAASPLRNNHAFTAPGAFPVDEDSWIGPPQATPAAPSIFSPRPGLMKSATVDVMDGIYVNTNMSGPDLSIPKQRRDDAVDRSFREPAVPDRTTSTLGHMKSASTSVLRSPTKEINTSEALLKKGISVSNPNLASATGNDEAYSPEPKSPSRSFRDSPLKAAKDKMSSILKTSKNLFASSAAASAAAKGTISPSPNRLGHHDAPSLEDVLQQPSLYPSLENLRQEQDPVRPDSPTKLFGIGKIGGLGEEYKRKDKESKEIREAQKRDEKLEKLREKESAKAKAFNQQEQERIAVMERQILAKKEQEQFAKNSQVESPRATRSSPRKMKAQLEGEGTTTAGAPSQTNITRDVEMTDAPAFVPAEFPRPATAAQVIHPREQAKRPMKPAKEAINTTKQAPVIIRVDTGSQRNPQRNLFHPSNVALSSSLQDSLPTASSGPRPAGPTASVKNKANVASVRPKASASSLKSVSSNTGKVRALEVAAKKKELEDQEAQRKRQKQLEMERKRAALQEEKQQEQRQQEAEKAREKERDIAASHMEVKKHGQRTAEKRLEIEKAKQQKPPPPAPRNHPAGDVVQASLHDKPLPAVPAYRGELGQNRPASRMETTIHRPEDDFSRSVSTLQNMTKAPPKRPLPQESCEESQPRMMQRNGPSSHAPDTKRRKTNEDQSEEVADNHLKGHMAPPIRQSGTRQKDVLSKSIFGNGYVNVPQPSHTAPSLHKAALNTQQMHRTKPAHPMDMAQTSKAPINFAPNPSQVAASTHKTPARPAGTAMQAGKSAGKSAGKPPARSSPRFQNGDSIELPEIPTDSEDEDEDDETANNFPVPGWANSPALRQGLMIQEGMDPVQVFGLPGEIRLEEVFKNTDRHPRFRARTSSANWSGSDRLTEDEVRNDLEARERLRREGGWSYGLTNISKGQ